MARYLDWRKIAGVIRTTDPSIPKGWQPTAETVTQLVRGEDPAKLGLIANPKPLSLTLIPRLLSSGPAEWVAMEDELGKSLTSPHPVPIWSLADIADGTRDHGALPTIWVDANEAGELCFDGEPIVGGRSHIAQLHRKTVGTSITIRGVTYTSVAVIDEHTSTPTWFLAPAIFLHRPL